MSLALGGEQVIPVPGRVRGQELIGTGDNDPLIHLDDEKRDLPSNRERRIGLDRSYRVDEREVDKGVELTHEIVPLRSVQVRTASI